MGKREVRGIIFSWARILAGPDRTFLEALKVSMLEQPQRCDECSISLVDCHCLNLLTSTDSKKLCILPFCKG